MTKERSNNRGFNVPDHYFEQFEENLEIRLLEEQLPRNTGFTVPSGYFDSLDNRVIVEAKTTESKVIKLVNRRTYWISAIAAAAVLILIILPFTGKSDLSMSSITPDNIDSYIENGGLEIRSSDLVGALDPTEIEEMEFEMQLVTDDLLEEYLLEEIEFNNLIIE